MSSPDDGLTDAMDMASDNSVEDMMSEMDTETAEMAPPVPVKLVSLVNYPVGGKAAYLAWVESVAPMLLAPEEVNRIASYDNIHGVSPHRFVEFEFESIEQANTYIERADIHATTIELPNRAGRAAQLLFEQRPDYE